MAAVTFNPLLLSAKASVRGAAVKRTAAKQSKRAAFTVKASDDDMDFMGEIGLGEEMEDMLAKAAGGSSVPKFIKDTGNDQLIEAFKFLGSDQMTGPGSEMLFVEKYGETLYREAGFTETAEKINGRLAQVGFVLALQNTFNGDVLTLMAKYPLLVALTVAGIAGASLVPVANPQGYFPEALKGSVMKAYESVGGGDLFSEKAETINGRAAMLGMGIFIATAVIF